MGDIRILRICICNHNCGFQYLNNGGWVKSNFLSKYQAFWKWCHHAAIDHIVWELWLEKNPYTKPNHKSKYNSFQDSLVRTSTILPRAKYVHKYWEILHTDDLSQNREGRSNPRKQRKDWSSLNNSSSHTQVQRPSTAICMMMIHYHKSSMTSSAPRQWMRVIQTTYWICHKTGSNRNTPS